jgi:hypothetical protein
MSEVASINDILNQIHFLNYEAKKEIYEALKKDLWHQETKAIDLKKYQGIAKNVWTDAQQYIDDLRNNDRI